MTLNERNLLKAVTSSSGWEVVLDMMEHECDTAERELLGAPVTDANAVITFHLRAQSFRMFFERLQKHISTEVNQVPEAPLPVLSPKEIMRIQLEQ